MRIGQKYITGTFAADQWVKIYENILSSAATSVTISSLDGDTDEEYLLITRILNTNSTTFLICPNNDTSSGNYGLQGIRGLNSSVYAVRNTTQTGITLNYGYGDVAIFQNKVVLYAKSGYIRTALSIQENAVIGTTVADIILLGESWNNTSSNITSLVINAVATNGLGIGTSIELWKKKYKS